MMNQCNLDLRTADLLPGKCNWERIVFNFQGSFLVDALFSDESYSQVGPKPVESTPQTGSPRCFLRELDCFFHASKYNKISSNIHIGSMNELGNIIFVCPQQVICLRIICLLWYGSFNDHFAWHCYIYINNGSAKTSSYSSAQSLSEPFCYAVNSKAHRCTTLQRSLDFLWCRI